MMDDISMDCIFCVYEIVSKIGANSADLNALIFYFKKLKLHEVKLTTENLSARLTKGFIKCNVNLFNKCINKCIFKNINKKH